MVSLNNGIVDLKSCIADYAVSNMVTMPISSTSVLVAAFVVVVQEIGSMEVTDPACSILPIAIGGLAKQDHVVVIIVHHVSNPISSAI